MIAAHITLIASAGIMLFADMAQADNSSTIIDLEIDVKISEYAPDGKSWDGSRIYILPVETTTVSPPEPAICIYTDGGEATCVPEAGSHEAPCPDSLRCTFNISLSRPFKQLTISVFDIDASGHEAARNAGRLLGQGLRTIEEFAGRSLSSEKIEREVLAANDRRWSWVESLSFEWGVVEGSRPRRPEALEHIARRHAAVLAPPQFTNFSTGRIRAPFALRSLGECLFPMPVCRLDYLEVSVRSKALETEARP